MSTNLFWRPLSAVRNGRCLSKELKYILAPKIWDDDGSMSENPIEVDDEFIPCLDGIIDAAATGSELCRAAQELKAAIERYGRVEILIE